jgi:hypothetical protein
MTIVVVQMAKGGKARAENNSCFEDEF